MRTLPAASINLIFVDPPYYKVKGEAWDQQWATAADFLGWMGELADEWQRVLTPNGSLYVCASPQMQARVECVIADRFEVLNSIVWAKDAGWHKKAEHEALRGYFPNTERIIFAEQRGFVFEPLRAYLAGERDRAGWTTRRVAEAFQKKTGSRTVTGMAAHWFESVQWSLPTAANYAWLRELFAGDFLRREHAELRAEYETLRRPFTVSAEVPYTDVWTFQTVAHYPGKHPCEKPAALLDHVIAASSRPGDVVFDGFMGSGATGERAALLGRRFIGCELGDYFHAAERRVLAAQHGQAFARSVQSTREQPRPRCLARMSR